jgi:hypothetical protein
MKKTNNTGIEKYKKYHCNLSTPSIQRGNHYGICHYKLKGMPISMKAT